MKEKIWRRSVSGRPSLLRVILSDMKKQGMSVSFLLGLCSVVFLMLLETYETFSNETLEKYVLLEIMLLHGKEWICSNTSFNLEEILLQQPGRQLMDFITVTASIPFLVQFCNERKAGNLSVNIFRTGRHKYYISKMVSCMLSGGIISAGGYIICSFCLDLFFPGAGQTGADLSFYLPEGLTADQFGICFFYRTLGMFFYGMLAAGFGAVLSAFTKDIYICLTIPFLIKWMNHIFHFYLYSYLYVEHKEIKGIWMHLMDWWNNYGSLEQVIYETQNRRLLYAGTAFLVIAMLEGMVFYIRMNRRKDYGE